MTLDPGDMSCRESARLVGVFLDGELDATSTLRVEDHLDGCDACRERLELSRALRGSLRRTVGVAMPADAKARVMAAMKGASSRPSATFAGALSPASARLEAPRAPLATRGLSAGRLRGLLSWRAAVPLSSAAAIALVWGAVSQNSPHEADRGVARAGFVRDPLADLVAEHSRPLPLDANPQHVRSLGRYVGVPVNPPRFPRAAARLVGGRVMTVDRERAAMLQYEMGQGTGTQRVSVFIYDPQKIRVGGPRLAARAVGTAEVQVGRAAGYSVAVAQRAGVGYALATDLDPDSSAELVADGLPGPEDGAPSPQLDSDADGLERPGFSGSERAPQIGWPGPARVAPMGWRRDSLGSFGVEPAPEAVTTASAASW